MSLDVSVVIPLYNEEPSVGELHQEITAALARAPWSYEIVFVDDGSTDGTYARLSALHAADPRVKVIRFRRNFGQTAGFAAGFAAARGRIIVTMDGDLQNDPADVPRMIEVLQHGYDIVCGWRRDRRDPWLTRKLPSMIANRLISFSTKVALHDYGCGLKVYRAEVVKPLRLYGELHRFIPAIASSMGVEIAEVEVNHRPRRHGRSNYGLSRTLHVVLDLLTVKFLLTYSTRPLQIFGLIGFLMGGAGAAMAAYLAYVRLFAYQSIAGRPLLLFAILLIFTGVQLVTLGLLAELQARTYHESQNKPPYVIREVLDADDREAPVHDAPLRARADLA